jgi:DNA-binding beta-propeller fold protein YncE
MRSRWVPLFAVASLIAGPVGAATRHYHVVQHFQPGGEGGWDYLTSDPAKHRLFFGRSTRTVVMDEATGKVLGEIPDTPGIHGVALAPELDRGFTSNGRDSSVTIFDLTSLKTIAKVHIDARNPDAILYEPVTKRVFTFNGGSGNATAIEAASGAIVGNIALNGSPEFAVADGKGKVYVNLEDSSSVTRFDAKTLKIEACWPIAPGQEPSGLAIDAAHERLFSVCSNQLMVVSDGVAGKVVTTVPIGKGPDAAKFDPATGLAFSSNGEGTITVVHEDTPDKYTVVENVPTLPRARTMSIDLKSHRLFTATAKFGETPAPTTEHPHPRPPMVPDSFEILVLDR